MSSISTAHRYGTEMNVCGWREKSKLEIGINKGVCEVRMARIVITSVSNQILKHEDFIS